MLYQNNYTRLRSRMGTYLGALGLISSSGCMSTSSNDLLDESLRPAQSETPPTSEEIDLSPTKDCRTSDDCAEGTVCVVRREDTSCEPGIRAARGPLGQPAPPRGMFERGRSSRGAQR